MEDIKTWPLVRLLHGRSVYVEPSDSLWSYTGKASVLMSFPVCCCITTSHETQFWWNMLKVSMLSLSLSLSLSSFFLILHIVVMFSVSYCFNFIVQTRNCHFHFRMNNWLWIISSCILFSLGFHECFISPKYEHDHMISDLNSFVLEALDLQMQAFHISTTRCQQPENKTV